MRRILGMGLVVLLIAIVGFAIIRGSGSGGVGGRDVVAVKAVIGSEKKPFFNDPDVINRFEKLGYQVTVDTAGSREIATTDLSGYDLAFPASVPAAQKIVQENDQAQTGTSPFFTPMVVATWQPIVDLLTPEGVFSESNGVVQFNVDKYLELVQQGKRWSDVPNNTTYPANKSILVSSTDVRRSNSAAMYQAVASYVANGNNVVSSKAEADNVMPVVSKIFIDQGYVPNTSAGPFGNYLSLGMGKVPMVFCYESQFLGAKIANAGQIRDDMVLAYPNPGVYSQHTVVALSDNGKKIGELLETDDELAALSAKYGFRPKKPGVFAEKMSEAGINPPADLVNVIDTPAYEIQEDMINQVASQYTADQPPVENPED